MYDCPMGFGYYIVKENDCGTFKLCESWDTNFSVVTLNKCNDNKIFSFKTFKCVAKEEFEYDLDENCSAYKYVFI